MIYLADMHVGARVTVEQFTGGLVSGTIVNAEEDIKNGLPGIDVQYDGDSHMSWAYMSQVKAVTNRTGMHLKGELEI
jgi:hypothetical protein